MSDASAPDHAALLRLGLAMIGRRIGSYEIITWIGAGGMGEVYRARDTRLDRDVAIKFLRSEFASDPQFRKRFEREAQVVSALEHPNICPLYDVGEDDHRPYLVMPLLEGETLGARMKKGAIAFDEALRMAMDIAAALDAAHRRGVTHRDLKPANVMLARTGGRGSGVSQVKLLDFGLAVADEPAAGPDGAATTHSARLTATGAFVGTLQYMAPEQLGEQPVDARADIWAFGCVLYEMLTGQFPFSGDSRASLISSIFRDHPAPVSRVQPIVPSLVDRVVSTCLAKDPNERFQSAHDLLLQLRWIAEGSGVTLPEPVLVLRRWRARVKTAAVAALGLWAIGATWVGVRAWRGAPTADARVQFAIDPPSGSIFTTFAMSPDGTRVAFQTDDAIGHSRLWVRTLDQTEPLLVAGGDANREFHPFWSPDGRALGYFDGSRLVRTDLNGGAPQFLCDVGDTFSAGADWSADGVILFSGSRKGGGVRQVSARGGLPSVVAEPDSTRGERNLRWPQFLPDGRHFLVYILTTGQGAMGLGTLDSPVIERLFDANDRAVYASGYLLRLREGTLLAQPFDPVRAKLTGEPVPVADHVGRDVTWTAISASPGGRLVHGSGPPDLTMQLAWLDRRGQAIRDVGEAGDFRSPLLSPNGTHLAFMRRNSQSGGDDIWTMDLGRGTLTRVSAGHVETAFPLWSPDGKELVFAASQGPPPFTLYATSASGIAQERSLSETANYLEDWSADGRVILFRRVTVETSGDLWTLSVDGSRKAQPVLASKFNETKARFSPDGRWLAYTSDETGRNEVYAQAFPPNGFKVRVSNDGGESPAWRADGQELYYLAPGDRLVAVAVRETAQSIEAGAAQPLFTVPYNAPYLIRPFNPDRDGRRFLVATPSRNLPARSLVVDTNWLAALKR